jgi:hypothetical protein
MEPERELDCVQPVVGRVEPEVVKRMEPEHELETECTDCTAWSGARGGKVMELEREL